MKRVLFFALLYVFVAWSVWAFADVNGTYDNETATPTDDAATDNLTDNSTTDNSTDNSVNYSIDLGNGDGALLIIGDGNQIYLPPKAAEVEDRIQPNEITYSASRNEFILVCTETNLIIDGTVTRFSKIVITLGAEGWDLIWYEQEN